MSTAAGSSAPMAHPASITTGQGSESLGNWMARGLSSQANRWGAGRAPAPTCNIPTTGGKQIIVPVSAPELEANAKLPDESAVTGRNASGSVESTQDDASLSNADASAHSEVPDDHDSQLEPVANEASEEEEADVLSIDTKAQKPTHKRGRRGKEKKKVGRPIAYRGDPNAPELTDQERRRIKRRIANRESARRVRHKRQEELEDMQIKMEQIQAHNTHLQQHANHLKHQKVMLCSQLEDTEGKYEKVSCENKQLSVEIQALRQSLQLKMSALEDELDRRASEAEASLTCSAFGAPPVQGREVSNFPVATDGSSTGGGSVMGFTTNPPAPLDWFPSLNLDDPRSLEMMQAFLEEPHGCPARSKRDENP